MNQKPTEPHICEDCRHPVPNSGLRLCKRCIRRRAMLRAHNIAIILEIELMCALEEAEAEAEAETKAAASD